MALIVAAIGLILVGWGAGEFVRAYTSGADLSAVRDLAQLRSPALTTASRVLSTIGSAYVVLPAALATTAVLYGLGRRPAAAVILLSTLGAIAIADLDKVLVDRPRPPVRHLQFVSSPSFPSGHASQATGFYLGALLVLLTVAGARKKWAQASWVRPVALIGTAVIVLGVCFSRVYLGVHYPTDVAAGLVLAGAWTFVVARALRPPGTVRREPAREGSSSRAGV